VRLISIKLAGFKSFVDPVTIPVSGQLVGVVGPNGCGKSNVIDAVRWVLGESQARHLRGASMNDVIFNGSASRKAISRASVELVFDNSAGRALGPWTQYGEISVKRVLTRNGESSYHINQTQVRRRDVMDVFLGTGLGAKTPYAIIEQGMISRIIEARPEELRGFLEEAAGISRYKERRRETETRLEHTRQNLLRLDDIRRTLTEHIAHLNVQAEHARIWQGLQQDLVLAQQLLWLLKLRDAQNKCHQCETQMLQLEQQLTAHDDKLRGLDIQLVDLHTRHDMAGDALNRSQGILFAVAAEVSRLEQSVRHVQDTQTRIELQLHQLQAQTCELDEQRVSTEEELAQRRTRVADITQQWMACQQTLDAHLAMLPQYDTQAREARILASGAQRQLAMAEQAATISQTQLQGAEKFIQQVRAQITRFQQEFDQLPTQNTAALADMGEQLATLSAECMRLDAEISATDSQLTQAIQQRKPVQAQWEQVNQLCLRQEGQLSGLRSVANQTSDHQTRDDWLARHGLGASPRIWQLLRVADGWENALELALGDWLQALLIDQTCMDALNDPRPEGWSWVAQDVSWNQSLLSDIPESDLTRLSSKFEFQSHSAVGILDHLLHAYAAETPEQAETLRTQLPPGAKCYTPQGHVLTRYGTQYPTQAHHARGILIQQKNIQKLAHELEQTQAHQAELNDQLAQIDQQMSAWQQQLQLARNNVNRLRQHMHQEQLAWQRQTHQAEQLTARRKQLSAELENLHANLTGVQQEHLALKIRLQQEHEKTGQAKQAFNILRDAQRQSEAHLATQRDAQHQLEREVQALHYTLRLEQASAETLMQNLQHLRERKEKLAMQSTSMQTEFMALDPHTPAVQLATAVTRRHATENDLAVRRAELVSARQALRASEEQRLSLQHATIPLNKQMETLRLAQQEATLLAAQCREQLNTLQANETELESHLPTARTAQLNQDIQRINASMTALGAVNLLALEELDRAQERENYLNTQTLDLETAISTLQQAMQSMDADTRSLFKTTFDQVNASMAALFSTLFGGGQAALVLTDNEWLDAGVQVIAQPPGKKNSSIQLLSGGEKTLTALALIFALFKLTPAPFCMLDEVDAPLDDSNTERYVRLVREMSASVQFLFITHNRMTMEAAGQLIGVTMQEAGVSRIVSVDLEQAAQMHGT
jgi:chromosome segregation protein